ncbi:hypothetical protein EBT25_09605 [bacterium]|nr:hypothetical protein [bacterium]
MDNELMGTTRMFPRTLETAFPRQYVNEGVFEGPYYSAPHINDVWVLFGLITVISMVSVAIWRYF